MSAIFVKMPPAMRSAEAPRDSPIAKPMKQGPARSARDEEQDAEHEKQLGRDEHRADRHAGRERNGVGREGLAPEAREGRARVRERVDADAEPGHAVAPADPDEAREEDHPDLQGLHVPQAAVVDDEDRPDEELQDEDELALRDEVRLARLVDELGHVAHRLVHGQVLQLAVHDEPESETGEADQDAGHEQRAARESEERHRGEVGQDELGLVGAGARRREEREEERSGRREAQPGRGPAGRRRRSGHARERPFVGVKEGRLRQATSPA